MAQPSPLGGLHVVVGDGRVREQLAQQDCALSPMGDDGTVDSMLNARQALNAPAVTPAGPLWGGSCELPSGGGSEGRRTGREGAALEIDIQQECVKDWLRGTVAQAWNHVPDMLGSSMVKTMYPILQRGSVHFVKTMLMSHAGHDVKQGGGLDHDSAFDIATALVSMLECVIFRLPQALTPVAVSPAGAVPPGNGPAPQGMGAGGMHIPAALTGALHALLNAKEFEQATKTLTRMFLRWDIQKQEPGVSEHVADDVGELMVDFQAEKWKSSCMQGVQVALKHLSVYSFMRAIRPMRAYWPRQIFKAFIAVAGSFIIQAKLLAKEWGNTDVKSQVAKQREKFTGIGLTALLAGGLRLAQPELDRYMAWDIADALYQGLKPHIVQWGVEASIWAMDAAASLALMGLAFENDSFATDDGGSWGALARVERQ